MARSFAQVTTPRRAGKPGRKKGDMSSEQWTEYVATTDRGAIDWLLSWEYMVIHHLTGVEAATALAELDDLKQERGQ